MGGLGLNLQRLLLVLGGILVIAALAYAADIIVGPATTNLGNKLYVDATGKVGIGTNAPRARLHVVVSNSTLTTNGVNISKDFWGGGDGHFAGAIYATDWWYGDTGIRVGYKDYSYLGFGGPHSYSLQVLGGGSTLMVAHPAGNVGIGNDTPGQKLTVAGVVESTSGGFKFPDGSVQSTAASGGGNASCPGGFTLIESAGQSLGCMQTDERVGFKDWFDAADDCFAAYGARLPSRNEWYVAMNNYALLQETDDWEWVADPEGYLVGASFITNLAADNTINAYAFRCWIPS